MSIATRTGDQGITGLMYNRRVPKHHPRVEACGAIDELNAALGVARAGATVRTLLQQLSLIQQDLVVVMGELATLPDDLPRYRADGFQEVSAKMVAPLDAAVTDIEGRLPAPRGWIMPGGSSTGAALDLARAVCRRAERQVSALQGGGERVNPEILRYLNRLSDLLWLLARASELPPDRHVV